MKTAKFALGLDFGANSVRALIVDVGNGDEAQAAMGGIRKKIYRPNPANHKVYLELYGLYRELHDAFGTKEWSGGLYNVMKDLLAIQDRRRR